jgi:hypothetical protein
MGKIVLYLMVSLFLGFLVVFGAIVLGLAAYVLTVSSGRPIPQAWGNAVSAGFIAYLMFLWYLQKKFEHTLPFLVQAGLFTVLPTVIFVFFGNILPVAAVIALIVGN